MLAARPCDRELVAALVAGLAFVAVLAVAVGEGGYGHGDDQSACGDDCE